MNPTPDLSAQYSSPSTTLQRPLSRYGYITPRLDMSVADGLEMAKFGLELVGLLCALWTESVELGAYGDIEEMVDA